MATLASGSAPDSIVERAALWGIDAHYEDAFGELQAVKPEVLAKLLGAIAPKCEPARRVLARTIVLRAAREEPVRIDAPSGLALRWEIWSDRDVARGSGSAPCLLLPKNLPTGLFRLRASPLPGDATEEATLIVPPERAYQGKAAAPRRMWAPAVQLYGVRSARNWGHGDFTDLMALIDLAAELGAAGVGLNPLHALFDDQPNEPSPYFPSSRLFLNPLYIDIEAIPEFPGLRLAGLDELVTAARSAPMIDYAAVASAKQRALALAYERFRARGAPQRQAAFARFREMRGPLLAQFACFEVLRRKFSAHWWDWPPSFRTPRREALDDLRRSEEAQVGFVEFVQWQAHEQLARCRARTQARGLALGLYLDIAVGVRRDGFDAWCEQDAILPGVTIGAPPDLLSRCGQDWGLAAFNPVMLEAKRFEPYRRMLRASMQYAGAIRLDHVLGLKRLFLVPAGMAATDGAYIRCPFEPLLAVTALASRECGCIVIGEDLGTVPENFRATLADWGLWSCQVMLFERSPSGEFLPPETYRKEAVVSFATHDLPTFAGWQEARDLRVRQAIAVTPGETLEERQSAIAALRRALNRSDGSIDFAAVAGFLAQAPSRLLIASLEDLLGVVDQVNLPGTTDTHPNWRRRLPVSLADLAAHPGLRAMAAAMQTAGRGRTPSAAKPPSRP